MNSWRSKLYGITETLKGLSPYTDQPLPEEVKLWLVRLQLLDGVPLSYLAADEKILPMESIRFFYLNPGWIAALTDGALSIGRMATDEAVHDSAHLPAICSETRQSLLSSRWLFMHESHRRTSSPLTSEATVQTGFLMRSALAAHWNGMEVRGFDRGDKPVELLRLDHLSDKIVIGIFNGEIARVEIAEPMEDLHFATRDGFHKIHVRYVDDKRIGQQTGQDIVVPEEHNGRINVKELAEKLEHTLEEAAGGAESSTKIKIGSAELALEMLSVAGKCCFRRKNE